ncbi:MAG TPA: hypothetical protein V6C65_17540, partial [Allocoleopsis sp.]
DLDETGWDDRTGAGLLNLAAAISLAKITQAEDYTPIPWIAPTSWRGEEQAVPMERAAAGDSNAIDFSDAFYRDFAHEFDPFPPDYQQSSGDDGYGDDGYGDDGYGDDGYGDDGYGDDGYGDDGYGDDGYGDDGYGDDPGEEPPPPDPITEEDFAYFREMGSLYGTYQGLEEHSYFIDRGLEFFWHYQGYSSDPADIAYWGGPYRYSPGFRLQDYNDISFWWQNSSAPMELRQAYWEAYENSRRAAFPEWDTREAPPPPPPPPDPEDEAIREASYLERLSRLLDAAAAELPDLSADYGTEQSTFITDTLIPQFYQQRRTIFNIGVLVDRGMFHDQMVGYGNRLSQLYSYVRSVENRASLQYAGERLSWAIADLSYDGESIQAALLPAKLIAAANLIPGLNALLENNSSAEQYDWGEFSSVLEQLYTKRDITPITELLPEESQFFLETLWQAEDEVALQLAGSQLWSVFQNTAPPEVMLSLMTQLFQAVHDLHTDRLILPDALVYDPKFLSELLLLSQAYAAIDLPIADLTSAPYTGGSFLDTLWSAANLSGYNSSYYVAEQLQEFLDGLADPIRTLRFTRSLLQALNQADIPDELKQDRHFLHELITLAQAYASVNPTDCPAVDPQFFLNTLWNAHDEGAQEAIDKGALELSAFIHGFDEPKELITYTRRLIKTAEHTPGLETERSDSLFLNELVNLGRTYAAIHPTLEPDSEPINFFLDTIWRAQSTEEIEKGVAELFKFVEGVNNPTHELKFASNLIEGAKQAMPTLREQVQDAAFLGALVQLGGAYA